MTYLEKRNRPKNPIARALVFTCVIIAIVLILIKVIFPQSYSSFFAAIARPFWRVQFSLATGGAPSVQSLQNENEELKRRLAENEIDMQSVKAIEAENTELKAIMGRASTTPYTLAAVLKRPPLAAYDELIIDIGKDFGVASSSKVYASKEVPIGIVTQSLSHTAKVLLFTSPNQKLEAFIGPSNYSATVFGNGGGQYRAKVPRDTAISNGDGVRIPSISSSQLGTVISVISDPAEPFEDVLIAPPVNIYSLKWVLVDTNNR